MRTQNMGSFSSKLCAGKVFESDWLMGEKETYGNTWLP